ncbi:MAG: DUF4428 domain-containing protein [Eubacteriales bacterium]
MGLFSKKEACPICGGKVGFLLPTKIDGTAICSDCSGKIDVPKDVLKGFTLDSFQDYLSFYDENQGLKGTFRASETIDFGVLDTKFVFDYNNKLFCMSKKLDKTIFEGSQITGFSIKEDDTLLYKYEDGELTEGTSAVRQAITMMSPILDMIRRQNRDNDNDDFRRNNDIKEPFKQFVLELYLDHPYWYNITADMDAPNFNDTRPDANDYLREYDKDIEVMKKLCDAFKRIAE